MLEYGLHGVQGEKEREGERERERKRESVSEGMPGASWRKGQRERKREWPSARLAFQMMHTCKHWSNDLTLT